MKDENAYKKSLVFSICYVGFATLALFSMYPSSNLSGDWTIFAIFFTFPVSVVSFGVRYMGIDNEILIVTTIQLIMFLLTWYLSYRFLKGKKPQN